MPTETVASDNQKVVFNRQSLKPLEKKPGTRWIDFDAMESQLEWRFAWQMRKTQEGLKDVFVQVPILSYRVDFLVLTRGKSIVVELDGRRYHDAAKDKLRDDRMISAVDAIIRIPYSAMTYNENATMAAIAFWFERFAVSLEIQTMEFSEAIEQVVAMQNRGLSDTSWIQVYQQLGDVAFVGSFNQICDNHDILPITIRRRVVAT